MRRWLRCTPRADARVLVGEPAHIPRWSEPGEVSGVGERALAVCRDDGHDVGYRSQWGGSDAVLARLFDARSSRFGPLLDVDWTRERHRPAGHLPDDLDYLALDAVYVVSSAGVTAFQPVWLGLSCRSTPAPTDGVLVRVESLTERRAVRAFARCLRGVLCDAVEGNLLTVARARLLLALALVRYCPRNRLGRVADTLWTPGPTAGNTRQP